MKTVWTDYGAIILTEDGESAWIDNGAIYKEPVVAAGGDIKTIDSLAFASVKTVNGLAIANVKTYDGVDA